MPDRLTVVAACTNRKTRRPDPALHVRSLGPEDRSQRWIERLRRTPRRVPALDLYAGDSWCQVRALMAAATARNGAADLAVLSAGYGLIDAGCDIAPYGATLASGHPDSVASGPARTDENGRWMAALAECGDLGGPRTVAALTSGRDAGPVLVCLGRTYLRAVAADLEEACATCPDPEDLAIVSSMEAPSAALAPSWVHAPGRLRTVLGGPLGSTSVRAGRAIVEDLGDERLSAPVARRVIERLVGLSEPLARPARRRIDDEALHDWIAAHLGRVPGQSAFGALRALRASGLACEQARFARAFGALQGRSAT